MSKKSDKRARDAAAPTRVSATDASRAFSELLDSVEAGHSFLVHRHGRDVCVMTPPRPAGRVASECLEILRGRPSVFLDDRFGSDLLEIVAGAPAEERPSWDS